ncbi:MAG: hypothetical protein GF398_09940 [Chitinivibrionales bacterium]|nr:hypothetical protein [Chitinivibrionales bacterium]
MTGRKAVILFSLLLASQVAFAQIDTTIQVLHNSLQRSYLLHVPSSYDGSEAFPLILDFHGLTSNSAAQAFVSGLRNLAGSEHFIIAWPQGTNNSWNAGPCCGAAVSNGVDDVDFARKVVADINQRYAVDAARIYATGLSNGSAMAQRLANDAGDLFAAAAGFAFMLLVDPNPVQPVPVINIHGYDDATVAYDGNFFHPSAQENFQTWATANNCQGIVTVDTISGRNKCETYTRCDNDVQVKLCSIEGGHVIYANTDNINVTRIAWEFLKQFSLPQTTIKRTRFHIKPIHHEHASVNLSRTHSKLTVTSNAMHGIEQIKLFALNGKALRAIAGQGSDFIALNIAQLNSGIYLLEVSTDTGDAGHFILSL